METLPYDLLREVWLELDDEVLFRVCALARTSTVPTFDLLRSICDDPFLWVVRASRMLGIAPSDFVNRSDIEQCLVLPGDTEGQRAQMRYIELVSRRGYTVGSEYFLELPEIMLRTALNDDLEQIILISRILKQKDLSLYHIVVNKILKLHLSVSPRILSALGCRVDVPVNHHRLRSVIKSGSFEEARKEINLWRPENIPENINQCFAFQEQLFKYALEAGNPEFFFYIANLSLSENTRISPICFAETFGQLAHPTTVEPFFQFYSQTNHPEDVLELMLTSALNHGRWDQVKIIESLIERHLSSPTATKLLRDVLEGVKITESYGLEIIDYFLRKGNTKRSIAHQFRMHGYYAVKAVAKWVWNQLH